MCNGATISTFCKTSLNKGVSTEGEHNTLQLERLPFYNMARVNSLIRISYISIYRVNVKFCSVAHWLISLSTPNITFFEKINDSLAHSRVDNTRLVHQRPLKQKLFLALKVPISNNGQRLFDVSGFNPSYNYVALAPFLCRFLKNKFAI